MSFARRGLAGLSIAAALTGCSLEAGQSASGSDAPSATAPARPTETSPAGTGIPLSNRARPPAHISAGMHLDRSQPSAARGLARAFLTSYVAYLYGQLPARRVVDLTPGLRQRLDSDRAEATPAERAARARIARLTVVIGHAAAIVVAVATVKARGEVSQLTATLQLSGSTWRVVAVAG